MPARSAPVNGGGLPPHPPKDVKHGPMSSSNLSLSVIKAGVWDGAAVAGLAARCLLEFEGGDVGIYDNPHCFCTRCCVRRNTSQSDQTEKSFLLTRDMVSFSTIACDASRALAAALTYALLCSPFCVPPSGVLSFPATVPAAAGLSALL